MNSTSSKKNSLAALVSNTLFLNIFSILVIAAVGCYFAAFVFRNAVNAPFFDDFAYLEYILKFLGAPDFFSFTGELLNKHNGHGVLTAKLAFWIDYVIEGNVNYRHLIIVSAAFVFVIYGYFLRFFYKNGFSIVFTLPVALLLFNPSYHENIFWAASSWQYTASFVTGILMYVFLADKSNFSFAMAILFGFITTYTNGNGLIGFLIGVVIPLIQKKYWKVGIWLIAVAITGVIFYWYYPYGLGSEKGREIATFTKTLIGFMGAGARYLRGATMDVVILGVVLLTSVTLLLCRVALDYLKLFGIHITNGSVMRVFQKHRINLSVLALMVWLFITGLGTAWTRGADDFSAALRFMIYSVMTIVVLYSLLILVLPSGFKYWVCFFGTLGGIIFQFGSYLYAAPEVIMFRNSLWADVYNLKNHRRVSGKVESLNNAVLAEHFEQALRAGIYVFPEGAIPGSEDDFRKIARPEINHTDKFVISRDTLPSYFGILITSIANDKIRLDESALTNSIYIALKDTVKNEMHLFAAKPTVNNNRKRFLINGNHFNEGITASVYAENIQPGWYKIGVLRIENETPSLYLTDQNVEIRKIDRIEKFKP